MVAKSKWQTDDFVVFAEAVAQKAAYYNFHEQSQDAIELLEKLDKDLSKFKIKLGAELDFKLGFQKA